MIKKCYRICIRLEIDTYWLLGKHSRLLRKWMILLIPYLYYVKSKKKSKRRSKSKINHRFKNRMFKLIIHNRSKIIRDSSNSNNNSKFISSKIVLNHMNQMPFKTRSRYRLIKQKLNNKVCHHCSSKLNHLVCLEVDHQLNRIINLNHGLNKIIKLNRINWQINKKKRLTN